MKRPRSRLRRVLRRIAIGAGVLLALVVVAFGGLLGILHTDWGREQLRVQVEKSAAKFVNGTLRIGKIEGSVVGDLVARDVTITGRGGDRVVTLAAVRLNLGLSDLASRVIRLEHLELEGLDVVVEAPAARDGSQPPAATALLQLADLIILDDEPLSWDVAIDRIGVTGSIEWKGPDGGRLERLRVDGRFRIAAGAALAVAGRIALDGHWRERDVDVAVRGDVRLASGVVDVPTAEIILGKTSVKVKDARVTRDQLAGIVDLSVAPDVWQLLVPGAPALPAATLRLTARGGDRHRVVPIAIEGTVNGASVRGAIELDEDAQRARGFLETTGLSPASFSAFAALIPDVTVTGRLDLDVVVDPAAPTVGLDAVRATAALHGQITHPGTPLETVVAGVGLVGRELVIVAGATGPGGARARVAARGHLGEGMVRIEEARIHATVPRLAELLPGGPVVRGAITADVIASGEVGTVTTYAVRGTATGRQLRLGFGGAPIDVDAVDVTARTQADGTIAVSATSTPHARTRVEARAVVDVEPGTISIALGRLRLRTPALEVSGRGGLVTITADRIVARDLQLAVDDGTLAVSGTFHRGGGRRAAGDVDVRARVRDLELASLDAVLGLGGVRGRVDAEVDGGLRGGRGVGEVELAVHGLRSARDPSSLDVAASVVVAPRRITVDGMARGATVGGAVFSLEAEPPRDLMDVVAWTRVDARAVRIDVRAGPVEGSAERAIDLAELTRMVGLDLGITGQVEGHVRLDATGLGGRLVIHDLTTPVIPDRIDADVTLGGGIGAPTSVDAVVDIEGIGRATARVTVATPTRPFDLRAWTRLDERALGAASLRAERIDLAPIAARLPLPRPWDRWAGLVTVVVDVEPRLAGATARFAVEGLRTGPLEVPIDAEVTATLRPDRIDATVAASLDGAPLMHGTAQVEVRAIAVARGGLPVLLRAPVKATIGGDDVPLASLLRAVGRRDRAAGTVVLAGTIGGTVAAPTGEGSVTVDGLRFDGADLGTLAATGRWDGAALTASVTGTQPGGGTLALRAVVAPDRLGAARVSLDATRFELGGLARLMPEPIADVRGRLEADLRIRGGDPATATATGIVRVRDAQVPLVPTIGTLRGASIDVTVQGGRATFSVDGTVGAGKVALSGSAGLAGLFPEQVTLDVRASNIQMVTPLQPIVTAVTHVEVSREADHWRAAVTVRKGGRVVVPDEAGQELAPTDLPADLVFTDLVRAGGPGRAPTRIGAVTRPVAPFLIADVRIEPTDIATGVLRGQVIGALTAHVGTDAIAVDGSVEAARGELTVFDRRYRIEEAKVLFDGSIDPMLDILISHAFRDLTLYIAVSGRSSDPAINFRSDPSIYSQGVLLSFVLGGTPGEAPGGELEGAARGVAVSVASSFVTGAFIERLPVRVDTLAVEAPTSTSSTALKAGRWISRNLYVAYRRRIEARADQNANEAELEYWLGRRLVLETITGDRGVHGLDLLWSRRW